MDEDVRLELPQEEESQRVRIGPSHGAGSHRAREIVGQQAQRAARWDLVVVRIKGHDHGRGVHLHGDGGTNDGAEEWHQASREIAEGLAGIGLRVELRQGRDELRGGDGPRAHGGVEQHLLRVEVAEDGRRRDVQRLGDVAERRRRESARAEGAAGGVEDLFAGDARGSAHVVSKRTFTNLGLSMAVY